MNVTDAIERLETLLAQVEEQAAAAEAPNPRVRIAHRARRAERARQYRQDAEALKMALDALKPSAADVELQKFINDLLLRHAAGDVKAGNEAFALADRLTKELTGADSFNELLESYTKFGYRPTIRPDLGLRYRILADLYDYAQVRRGLDVKAYRG